MNIRSLAIPFIIAAVAVASPATARSTASEVELEARAEAVRNFAVSAYKAIHTHSVSSEGEALDKARYFADVEAYRRWADSTREQLDRLDLTGASLSAEIVGEPSSSPSDPSLTEWTARFKARESTVDRKGQTDRCLEVEVTVAAIGDLPLGDSYSVKALSQLPAADADCSIVAALPMDKETLRLELINRQNSLGGFLQSASATMFALDYTVEEPQFQRSMRFFSDENAFETYRTAISNMGLFAFLKHNQMISTGTYMGNLTFEKAEGEDVWHTAFYVKQRFVEPGFELSRCIGIAAEVRDLPAKFGGGEYAIEAISMHPMEDDSACESGKELTAAMWNLINAAREPTAAQSEADGQTETR